MLTTWRVAGLETRHVFVTLHAAVRRDLPQPRPARVPIFWDRPGISRLRPAAEHLLHPSPPRLDGEPPRAALAVFRDREAALGSAARRRGPGCHVTLEEVPCPRSLDTARDANLAGRVALVPALELVEGRNFLKNAVSVADRALKRCVGFSAAVREVADAARAAARYRDRPASVAVVLVAVDVSCVGGGCRASRLSASRDVAEHLQDLLLQHPDVGLDLIERPRRRVLVEVTREADLVADLADQFIPVVAHGHVDPGVRHVGRDLAFEEGPDAVQDAVLIGGISGGVQGHALRIAQLRVRLGMALFVLADF